METDLAARVASWFDHHFVLTDGCFNRKKPADEKRYSTVMNLEILYQHYRLAAIANGDTVPDKIAFAFTLQRTRGVYFKFVKNQWVGAIKQAANVRPKLLGCAVQSAKAGDALLTYARARREMDTLLRHTM